MKTRDLNEWMDLIDWLPKKARRYSEGVDELGFW